MANRMTALKSLPLALALGGFIAAVPVDVPWTPMTEGVAFAQKDDEQKPKRRTKKTYTMNAKFVEFLEKAQAAMDGNEEEGIQPNPTQATAILQDAERKTKKMSEYEHANLNIMHAFIAFEKDDPQGAIKYYERNAAMTDVPPHIKDQSLFALAQLYMSIEEWQKSINFLKQWFDTTETTPNHTPYLLLAQAHYQLEDFNSALEPMLKVISMTEEKGEKVRENWWQLLMSVYYQQGNLPKVKEILTTLILEYSKPNYWTQLAGVESEIVVPGEPEGANEKRSLAVMDVAYRQGYLARGSQQVNMAQLYMYHGAPITAAWVMEKGLANETIEKTEKNYEILSQAYINSQEMAKALAPLEKAAAMSEEGELYIRLGQVHFELDELDKCIEAIKNGLKKGKVKNPDNARQVMGMCTFNKDTLKATKDAHKIFVALAKSRDKDIAKAGRQWVTYLGKEIKRREDLAKEGLGD